ncbi:unnamed protein product, partial [Mycena citricolor]
MRQHLEHKRASKRSQKCGAKERGAKHTYDLVLLGERTLCIPFCRGAKLGRHEQLDTSLLRRVDERRLSGNGLRGHCGHDHFD